jgi:hypothetical protein
MKMTVILPSMIVVAFAALKTTGPVFAESPPAATPTANSNLQRVAIPVDGMSCATCESAKLQVSEKASVSEDRISIFQVSLECPAAPQIGCGTASKPILLRLEREPSVAEAWLNRAGRELAIVWKPEADTASRRSVSVNFTDDGKEIAGKSRDEALKSFLSGQGWYHAADVDRLSEEEAGIIAARLVRRVQAKTSLPQDRAKEFQAALAESWSKCVTSGEHVVTDGRQPKCRFEDILENIASQYLTEDERKILKEAVAAGVRPLPNED